MDEFPLHFPFAMHGAFGCSHASCGSAQVQPFICMIRGGTRAAWPQLLTADLCIGPAFGGRHMSGIVL